MDPCTTVISVLIVDDHPLVREGTRRILEDDPSISVCGEAGSAEEGFDLARSLRPDVVVVDIRLPGINGIEMTRQLLEGAHEIAVLVLSAFAEPEYLRAALAAGARGYILKSASAEELTSAVHRAFLGETVIDPTMQEDTRLSDTRAFAESLTEREREILTLISKGMSNKAIASALGISRRTVEGHVSRMLNKIGIASRTELLLWGIEHHLIVMD